MTAISRRLALAAPALVFGTRAMAQPAWPARPVTLLVPFAAGGSNDVVGRMVAPHLDRKFGQPFVADNRPGGGGALGMGMVARARPDGYTILVSSASNHVFHPLIAREPNARDAREAFAGISLLTDVPNVVAVHPSVPVSTVPELIAWVRAQRNGVGYGSSGVGTSNHLAGELFRLRTGLDMTHVPYRGGGPGLTDLVAGTIKLGFMNLPTILPAAQDGRVKIIAVCTAERVSIKPDIPTVQEQGVRDYAVRSWTGFFAPAGTPPAILQAMSEATREALAIPAVRQRLSDIGSEPIPSTPEETDRFVRDEYARWEPVVRAANISPD